MAIDRQKMGEALRGYFGQGMPKPFVGPQRPDYQGAKSQQPPQPGYGPVPFEDALRAIGPAPAFDPMRNPGALNDYQNNAKAVAAAYGMRPRQFFLNATPDVFQPVMQGQRYGQRQFDDQFRQQFAQNPRPDYQGAKSQQPPAPYGQRQFDDQFRQQFPAQTPRTR